MRPSVKPEAETSSGGQASETRQPSGQPAFAALLAAAMPQAVAGEAQIATVQPDTALATLLADANALVQAFQTETGTADLSGMVVAFADLLQKFDASTGGDAASLFLQNLTALDSAGFAALDGAARDPASLLASLSALAGLPVAEKAGQLVAAADVPAIAVSQNDTPYIPEGLVAQEAGEGVLGRSAAPPLSSGLSPRGENASLVPDQTNVTAAARMDLRGAVLSALTAAGVGPQPEAVPLTVTASDMRSALPATPDIARPADLWQPPTSVFARNLAQQIRQATITEGQTRITLAPRGLGEIEIDMSPDEAGKLRIVLRADNPAVLQALRGDRDGLLLTLTSGGTDIRDADLSFEDFSHRQHGDQDRSDTPARAGAEPHMDEPAAPAGLAIHSTADGALDMLT